MASRPLSIQRGLAMLAKTLALVLAMPWVMAQAPTPGPPATAGHAAGHAAVERLEPSRPILPPADPTAAAVYGVLEKHCARCHQGGRLRRAAPAAGFGNILRLDEIAALPHLVQPGNPDASRLYVMMLRRLMPIDMFGEGPSEPAPTAEDIAAVRSWISGLPPRSQCLDRRPVTPADQRAALAQIVSARSEDPSKLRFVSIAHLHNGCVRFEALSAYRQAIVRLFNSLSWKSAPVSVVPVDNARTLFKINLDDLGWLPEHWERIMQGGSDPLGLAQPLPAEASRPFGTATPVVRADWLTEAVLTAPLYYDVLGLPGTGPEILKILRADTVRPPEGESVARAGVRPSRFALQPSLIERVGTRNGPFWQAYHQFAREGAVDLAQQASRSATDPVPYHASRGMFTLPNGLPGFFIVGQRGDRLDALPPDIASPSASLHGEIRAGLDCLACHGRGPAERDLAGLPPPVADTIHADRMAAAEALRRIGVDPLLTLDGVDPVIALAQEHARPLDGARAAAEIGISLDELSNLAGQGDGLASILARRLVQGLVSRMEVEFRARDLLAALGRASPESAGDAAKANNPPVTDADFRPIDPGPAVILYSDKARYRKGDLLSLVVRAASDCHLTLVSIDQRGRGTVIFPSDFESNTLLAAGQELKLPGTGAPYAFRLNEAGRETIVALCNEAGSLSDGIRHDFERQRFTDLGNYATYLEQNAFADAARPDAATARRHEPRQSASRRRGRTEKVEERAPPERISRVAISIVVD